MSDKEIHEKAIRLCEGGAVEINGLWVRTRVVEDDINPCEICEMDCLCRMEMTDLCGECEAYDRKRHLLYLPNP